MKKVNDESLVEITGGTSTVINGSFVNAFVNVIKLLMDAGISVGSSSMSFTIIKKYKHILSVIGIIIILPIMNLIGWFLYHFGNYFGYFFRYLYEIVKKMS